MASRTSRFVRFGQPALLLAAGALLGVLLNRSIQGDARAPQPVTLITKKSGKPVRAPSPAPALRTDGARSTSTCPALIPALQCFTGAVLKHEEFTNTLYSQDAQVISKTLARYMGGLTWKGDVTWYAIDIGANSGQTAVEMLNAFTLLGCLSLRNSAGFDKPPDCNDGINHVAQVFSIEPMPDTFAKLKAAGVAQGWVGAGWTPYQYAISDVSDPKAVIYGASQAGNEQPSLNKAAARVDMDAATAIPVEAMTAVDFLDRHYGAWRKPTSRCFLLKVDAEGYDPMILRASTALLEQGHTKFVLFEYNAKWRDAESSARLHTVIKLMESHRYSCAYITRELLLPVTTAFWSDNDFEQFMLSNVLCGYDSDPDWLSLRRAFSRPHVLQSYDNLMERVDTKCSEGVPKDALRTVKADISSSWNTYLDCLGW